MNERFWQNFKYMSVWGLKCELIGAAIATVAVESLALAVSWDLAKDGYIW